MLVGAAVVERRAHLLTAAEADAVLATHAPGSGEVDGSGARTSAMHAVRTRLPEEVWRALVERARGVLTVWESASTAHAEIARPPSRFKARLKAQAGPALTPSPEAQRVHLIEGIFSSAECGRIIAAAHEAAQTRGGWDISRHGRYPTTDMPLTELGPEVEPYPRLTRTQTWHAPP